MQNFSTLWKSSKKPKKQRKYMKNSPSHIKNKFLHVHLSNELRKKIGKKAIRVRKGDKVKIMKGQFKDKSGNVERVDTKKFKVYVSGVEFQKKDGSKIKFPVHVSNIMLIEINTSDKKRQKRA